MSHSILCGFLKINLIYIYVCVSELLEYSVSIPMASDIQNYSVIYRMASEFLIGYFMVNKIWQQIVEPLCVCMCTFVCVCANENVLSSLLSK